MKRIIIITSIVVLIVMAIIYAHADEFTPLQDECQIKQQEYIDKDKQINLEKEIMQIKRDMNIVLSQRNIEKKKQRERDEKAQEFLMSIGYFCFSIWGYTQNSAYGGITGIYFSYKFLQKIDIMVGWSALE